MFGLILEADIYSMENSSLEDLWVVCYHEGDLINLVLVISLVDLDFMEDIGGL